MVFQIIVIDLEWFIAEILGWIKFWFFVFFTIFLTLHPSRMQTVGYPGEGPIKYELFGEELE